MRCDALWCSVHAHEALFDSLDRMFMIAPNYRQLVLFEGLVVGTREHQLQAAIHTMVQDELAEFRVRFVRPEHFLEERGKHLVYLVVFCLREGVVDLVNQGIWVKYYLTLLSTTHQNKMYLWCRVRYLALLSVLIHSRALLCKLYARETTRSL